MVVIYGPLRGPLKPRHGFFSAHVTINSDLMGKIETGRIIVKPNIKRFLKGKGVEFEDGSIEEGIDLVYYCTGYHIEFPFLEREILNGGRDDVDLEYNEVWLYKNIFPPKYENIAFIGLVQPLGTSRRSFLFSKKKNRVYHLAADPSTSTGAIMPISEIQSRYALSLWLGRLGAPPTILDMNAAIDRTRRHLQRTYVRSPRHTIQVFYHAYMDMLADDLGCKPTLFRLGREFEWNWRLIWSVYNGPQTPCQYRLLGEQKWAGAKRAVEEYSGYKWEGKHGDEKNGFWFSRMPEINKKDQ
ncbi:flavin-binding monooxygenase-like-domain-containing protein [Jimgerdemannia flammicorona]|uniref:Flavin-binding monooxygenase-like-domain-containing protein n=1 Tax=Jimgerdemannia flammicorona TaxID=994334 RepID=A0A433A115_9FUNG|nr:flavin-binding monooxygenase-like-domain-containing protein [Jimgerdemannia flammicorona]